MRRTGGGGGGLLPEEPLGGLIPRLGREPEIVLLLCGVAAIGRCVGQGGETLAPERGVIQVGGVAALSLFQVGVLFAIDPGINPPQDQPDLFRIGGLEEKGFPLADILGNTLPLQVTEPQGTIGACSSPAAAARCSQ